MITKQQIREILVECTGTGLPADFDDATPVVLDSYVAAWMQQLLEDRFGAVVVLTQDIAGSLDTVDALHAYVNQSRNSPGAHEDAAQDQP